MKATVVGVMEEHRTKRLYKARVEVLVTRIKMLWEARRQLSQYIRRDEVPSLRDFALFPEVRAIVEAPNDAEVTPASFDVLRTSISDIVDRWYSEKKTFFEELVRKSIGPECSTDISPLDLAMSLGLLCEHARMTTSFPRVIYRCCGRFPSVYMKRGKNEFETALNLDREISEGPLDYDHITVDTNTVGNVIKACGQDPHRVTVAEMDNLNTRLTCVTCDEEGVLGVMTWRAAVRSSVHYQKYRKYLHANILYLCSLGLGLTE